MTSHDGNERIDEFIEYVSLYVPRFSESIRGAERSEVDTLERLCLQSLPSDYKGFLYRMGNGDGGLQLGHGATTNIADLIEFYKEAAATKDQGIPSDCVLIAVNGVGVDDVALQFAANKDPRVVFLADSEPDRLYAESFQKLLYRTAFMKYRAATFPYSGIYVNADRSRLVGKAAQIAKGSGFEAQWFSDSIALCAEGKDAAIIINQFERQGVWLRVAGDSKAQIELLAKEYEREIGVKFDRWWP